MAIEIKSLYQLEFDVRGTVFTLNKPSLGQQAEYEQALKESQSNGSSIFKLMIDYLVKLGMPQEVASNLTNEEFQLVNEAINGSKKN